MHYFNSTTSKIEELLAKANNVSFPIHIRKEAVRDLVKKLDGMLGSRLPFSKGYSNITPPYFQKINSIPQGSIFHYVKNANNALKIIESGEFLLSNYTDLNEEIIPGRSIVVRELMKYHQLITNKNMKNLLKMGHDYLVNGDRTFYIGSFTAGATESADHWQRYGDYGKGICLVFSRTLCFDLYQKTKTTASDDSVHHVVLPHPMHYDKALIANVTKECLRDFDLSYKQISPLFYNQLIKKNLIGSLGWHVDYIGLHYRKKTYISDQELRILPQIRLPLSITPTTDLETYLQRLRNKGTVITDEHGKERFVLDLRTNGRIPLEQIIIGSNIEHKEAVYNQIKYLIQNKPWYTDVEVKISALNTQTIQHPSSVLI